MWGSHIPLFLTLYCIITMKEGNCHVTQAAPYVKKSVPDFPDSVWKRPVFPCGRRLYPSIRHHHRRHNRSGPRICALVPHADHSVRTVLQCPDLFARAFRARLEVCRDYTFVHVLLPNLARILAAVPGAVLPDGGRNALHDPRRNDDRCRHWHCHPCRRIHRWYGHPAPDFKKTIPSPCFRNTLCV